MNSVQRVLTEDNVTDSLHTAASKLVSAPWAFTLEEKLAIIEGLVISDSREGLQLLRKLLDYVEMPLRSSLASESAKYGGAVVNAVTAGIARMTIVGAFSVLESAYERENAEPLLRTEKQDSPVPRFPKTHPNYHHLRRRHPHLEL